MLQAVMNSPASNRTFPARNLMLYPCLFPCVKDITLPSFFMAETSSWVPRRRKSLPLRAMSRGRYHNSGFILQLNSDDSLFSAVFVF